MGQARPTDSYNLGRSYDPTMTRAAVEAGFEHYLEEMLSVAAREFNVVAALNGGVSGPGGRLTDRLVKRSGALERHVVQPQFDVYRRDILAQFDLVLDYAESDADIEPFADDLLAHDSFYDSLRSDLSADRREAVRETLLARDERLGDAVAPLVASAEADFWDAAVDAYEASRADELVADTFSFTRPLDEYPDVFVFETTFEPSDVLGGLGGLLGSGLPPVTVEYTAEAVRVMRRAEETVRHRASREAERQFADG